jgi:hypothetical protein
VSADLRIAQVHYLCVRHAGERTAPRRSATRFVVVGQALRGGHRERQGSNIFTPVKRTGCGLRHRPSWREVQSLLLLDV